MQIKDIMTQEVISVDINTRVTEISQILTTYGIHGVPVINENKIVVGIVTESDFFIKEIPNLYLPTYINYLKNAEFVKNNSDEERVKIEKLIDARASDIMTRECTTVEEELDVNGLIDIFRNKHFTTIPVVDKDRKLSGIVSVADIIRLVKSI